MCFVTSFVNNDNTDNLGCPRKLNGTVSEANIDGPVWWKRVDKRSIKTQKHSSEKERNITINIGYANAKIYQNSEGKYFTAPSDKDNLLNDFGILKITYILIG